MTQNVRAGLLALLLLTGGVAAQTPATPPSESQSKATPIPVLFRLSYWEVDDATLKAIVGKMRIAPADLKTARRIQTSEVLSVSGAETLVHLGRKDPIVYYDPRYTQFQIQYVDTGMKLDVRWRTSGPKEPALELRQELAMLSSFQTLGGRDPDSKYPQTEAFINEAVVPNVKLGDMLFLGHSSGVETAGFVRLLSPSPKLANLIATIEMEAP